MFRHHHGYSPSTGEPPTPPLGIDDRLTTTRPAQSRNDLEDVPEQQESSSIFFGRTPPTQAEQQSERGRSNTIPSQDSGYEMSPSLTGGQSLEFFLESDVFDEDDNCSETLPVEDDELCTECADLDDFCNCLRSCSSTTTVRSRGTPSNVLDVYCDMCTRTDEQSSCCVPPSSLPIEIPVVQRRYSSALPSPSFSRFRPLRSPPHSLPIAPSSTHLPVFQAFLSRSHPRVLPSIIVAFNRLSPVDVFSNQRLVARSPPRNRLRQIDSSFSSSIESFFDATSLDTLDDDNVFQEEFEMAEDDMAYNNDYNRPRLNSIATVRQPLPDLVQHGPAYGRRNRSASINLPCDHEDVLRDIGRSLRRISDDFQRLRRQSGGDFLL